jgi:hypothetical protein
MGGAGVAIQVYSVTGPSHSTSEYLGSDVPGGADYLELAANQLAQTNSSVSIKLCIGHAVEWGPLTIHSKFKNLTLCPHLLQLDVLGMRVVNHPSSQHGTILNWLLETHPPESDKFIVMDPDFFMTKRNGLLECMRDVQDDVLTAGVCYPSKFPKGAYWDFPVVYFQIFRSNSIWDFSPESSVLKLPGEHLTTVAKLFDRVIRILSRVIPVSAALKVIEGKNTSVAPWKSWLMQLLRIPLEVSAGDPDEMRDTGYKNRAQIKFNQVRMYQNVEKISHLKLKFNDAIWKKNNPGIDLDGIPPVWYAMRHGTLEKRNFHSQPLALRLLALIPVRGKRGGPPSQVSNLENLGLNARQLKVSESLHRLGADLYSRDGVLLGFHMGSNAKSNVMKYIGGFDGLQNHLGELSGDF